MYLNFYNLKKEPFQITPDPSFLYLSPGHKEALASIMYGVEKRKGFILIMGAVGVGKTTILRAYLEKVSAERLRIIYLFNANISYFNLLKYIFRELGITPETDEIFEMVNQLHQALIKEYREGRNVLVLIDEAQNMPLDTLENLRMLSNLETTTEKLIQIVFSAQLEFDKTLNMEELKQLKQRIAVKAVISALTAEEGFAYIQHRLKRAAAKESVIFTNGALREIVNNAKGIPRLINILCDNSLITAFGYGKKKVGLAVVKEIARDLGMQKAFWRGWRLGGLVAALSVLVIGIAYWAYSEKLPLLGARPALSMRPPQMRQHATPADQSGAGDKARPAASGEKVLVDNRAGEPGGAPGLPAAAAEDLKERGTVTGQAVSGEGKAFVNRVIERGDTLAKLVKDVYGHVDHQMIRMVKNANPGIENENLIIEGGRIVFPVKKSAEVKPNVPITEE